MEKKELVHYTSEYLLDPQHPITILVIGCGGTGSQVLSSLARMHTALNALGHPGFHVTAIDDDKVSQANLGRQLFSSSEVNEYKSVALISRINRFFGLEWEAATERYEPGCDHLANIFISCVDSGAARSQIKKGLTAKEFTSGKYRQPYERALYWLDFGNMQDRGQAIIGTLNTIKQPKKSKYVTAETLHTVDYFHPDILKDKKSDNQGPSCSLAEALGKQDLFINTNLANMGLGILWKMFREGNIKHQGVYLNLNNLCVNPLKIV